MHVLFDQRLPKAAVAFCLVVMTSPALAQKLPGVQEKGLHVPSGLKIDGKTAEWDNPFQAFNKNIGVIPKKVFTLITLKLTVS